MITNYDLLFNPACRTDFHYIVTRPPVETRDGLVLRVDLQDQNSAALDGYTQKPALFISDIRSGIFKDQWLLSGGTLIMDCADPPRIAVGIRDANATDPFTYTNIGAGRCDQKLFDHCMEEFETEFILGIRNDNTWQQVQWGVKTPSWVYLKNPDIQVLLKKIVPPGENSISKAHSIKVHPHVVLCDPHALFQKVTIQWNDFAETIHGYVWIDATHHTTEFRLPVSLDLSPYKDSIIFFGEGTGYALWKTVKQMRALAFLEEEWGTPLLTPFLKEFVTRAE